VSKDAGLSVRLALAAPVALCMLAGVGPQIASAQNCPAKPVRIIVAFPAGGGTDIVARVLGQKLTEAKSQAQ